MHAAIYLLFILPFVTMAASHSDTCQNRPCSMMCSMLQSVLFLGKFSTCFTSYFTADTNLAFTPHLPFGLFPSMTATQDRTRLHWCCSQPDCCRKFSTQAESVALKSVNTSVCVLLTAPPYKKQEKWSRASSCLAFFGKNNLNFEVFI